MLQYKQGQKTQLWNSLHTVGTVFNSLMNTLLHKELLHQEMIVCKFQ